MIQKFFTYIIGLGADLLIQKAQANKEQVVKIMNSKVNLPMLNEKQEAELFSKWFDAFVEGIEYLKDMDKK